VARATVHLEALRDRNFFVFFHTYAVHNPFRPRQPHLRRLTGRTTAAVVDVDVLPPLAADGFRDRRALFQTERGRRIEAAPGAVHELAVDLYDSGIAFADERLDDLLASIDRLGLRERTLIVVTSDHGELFGEHGQVNHISLFDENVMVPLVFLDPARGPGIRRIGGQVRSIDLLPTILERLGLPPPAGIDGRSFAPLLGRGGGAAGDGGAGGTGDAWSYASASNFGIALRRPDGTAYVARNDAWISAGPREELLGAAGPAAGAEVPALRDAAERHLRGALAGLRIRLRNPSDRSFAVTVRPGGAMTTRMKLDRLGAGVLTAAGNGPARLAVAPGEDVTLVVEGPSAPPLRVAIDHPRWGSSRFALDPAALEAPLWGGWTAGRWSLGEVEPPDGGALAVWWQGKGGAGDAAPASATDEALLRQLRALGYLR